MAVREDKVQRGCMKRDSRKRGPDFWQFRWSEISLVGKASRPRGAVTDNPDAEVQVYDTGHFALATYHRVIADAIREVPQSQS
jgi:hypothetical protein